MCYMAKHKLSTNLKIHLKSLEIQNAVILLQVILYLYNILN